MAYFEFSRSGGKYFLPLHYMTPAVVFVFLYQDRDSENIFVESYYGTIKILPEFFQRSRSRASYFSVGKTFLTKKKKSITQITYELLFYKINVIEFVVIVLNMLRKLIPVWHYWKLSTEISQGGVREEQDNDLGGRLPTLASFNAVSNRGLCPPKRVSASLHTEIRTIYYGYWTWALVNLQFNYKSQIFEDIV